MLSRQWDGAYKRTLAANWKIVAHVVVAAGFLSHYLNGPLGFTICPMLYNCK